MSDRGSSQFEQDMANFRVPPAPFSAGRSTSSGVRRSPSTRRTSRRGSGGLNLSGAFDAVRNVGRTVQRASADADAALLRTVSRLGVDPRSPEGMEILTYLDAGLDAGAPEIKELVLAYQDSLVGPQSKSTRSGRAAVGPGINQYGYRKGEEYSILDGLSTEQLARTQDRLVALGILDGYTRGRIDPNTVKAFSDVLWMANSEGRSWTQTIGDLERTKAEMGDDWAWGDGSGSGDRAPFVAPTYLAPDYATLAQRVKTELRDQLGRDPDESELALLTAELSGWDREAFDAEEAAARAEWEAAEDGRDASPTAQAVDPVARFKESFESKFKAELRGIQRTEEATETSENVRGAVGLLSQMSGGMG